MMDQSASKVQILQTHGHGGRGWPAHLARVSLYSILVFCLVALTAPTAAQAQQNPGPNAINVTPRIVSIHDLRFGRLASEGAPGRVTVDAATNRKIVSGGAVDLGGRHRTARFRIHGNPGSAFVIIFPNELVMPGRAQSSNQVRLTNFHTDSGLTGVLPRNGKLTVQVGATLEMDASEATDIYEVPVTFVVEYQ